MLHKLIWGYVAVAGAIFTCLISFGMILKKDILGNGVKCGILNSFLISALWPIGAMVSFGGMCYEVVKTWKKL